MSDYRTYRDNTGGKAIVDLQSDTQASVLRTIQAKIVVIIRPLSGRAAVGVVLSKSINIQNPPAVLPWHVTTSQAVHPGLVSTASVKGG